MVPIFRFHRRLQTRLLEMLLPPTLALLAIVLNFCALLRVTTNRNGLSTSGWYTIEEREGATARVYANYKDLFAPLPATFSPVYTPALRRAEWAYRSSAVRILELVDGSNKVQTVSNFAPPRSHSRFPPSPTKPTKPVVFNNLLSPSLTSRADPATFESFPTRDPSTLSMATSPVARSLGLMALFSSLVCAGIFAWLKVRGLPLSQLFLNSLNAPQDHPSWRSAHAQKPALTCNVNCRAPVEDFHSMYTATTVPSYAGSEVDVAPLESGCFPGSSPGSHAGYSTTPRTFPVVITNSDGQTLFNAEIKLSSERVVTMLSATTSTVSFSLDVVASLDVPIGAPIGNISSPPELTCPPSVRVVRATERGW